MCQTTTTPDAPTTTAGRYLVPECNRPTLEARLAKLNKRAAKLGVAAIAVAWEVDHHLTEYTYREHTDGSGCAWIAPGATIHKEWVPTGRRMPVYGVTVTGVTPQYNGWRLVAVLTPLATDEGATNLIAAVPGETCPAEYRNRIGQCDHCKAQRRRKETFVVRHEDGTHRMVGRQCIADFLGGADPHGFAATAEWMRDLADACGGAESMGGWGGSGDTGYDLGELLMWAARAVAVYGWLSKTKAHELNEQYGSETKHYTSTAAHTMYAINRPWRGNAQTIREWLEERAKLEAAMPEDAARALATAATEWAANIPADKLEDEANNYLANIHAIAHAGYVPARAFGVAASIMGSYQREQDMLKERERRAALPPSAHVGTVKQRLVLEVTCERIISREGTYGTTGIHKLVDKDGNDLTWFATSATWLEEGKRYEIKATVTAHGDYKGRPQTTINRVAVVRELDAAPIAT